MLNLIICIIIASVPAIACLFCCVLCFIEGDKELGVICLIGALAILFVVIVGIPKFQNCPECGYYTEESWCRECGTELIVHCPGCGEEYPGKVPTFCPECGTNLKEVTNAN